MRIASHITAILANAQHASKFAQSRWQNAHIRAQYRATAQFGRKLKRRKRPLGRGRSPSPCSANKLSPVQLALSRWLSRVSGGMRQWINRVAWLFGIRATGRVGNCWRVAITTAPFCVILIRSGFKFYLFFNSKCIFFYRKNVWNVNQNACEHVRPDARIHVRGPVIPILVRFLVWLMWKLNAIAGSVRCLWLVIWSRRRERMRPSWRILAVATFAQNWWVVFPVFGQLAVSVWIFIPKYPCGHKCRSNCHPGECPGADACRKKIKLSCPCGRVKKDTTCDIVRQGKTAISCDDECQEKKEEERLVSMSDQNLLSISHHKLDFSPHWFHISE